MIILGLTGSIGMGKSTTADFFKALNIPVFDADATVHNLYETELVEPIAKIFPKAVLDHKIDRNLLAKEVLDNPDAMNQLENIVHPVIRSYQEIFIKNERAKKTPLVVLDLPLLFEKKLEQTVDKILLVTAPFEIQRERVLSRKNMNKEKFQKILNRQIPDSEKRKKADFIIETHKGLNHAKDQVSSIVKNLTSE